MFKVGYQPLESIKSTMPGFSQNNLFAKAIVWPRAPNCLQSKGGIVTCIRLQCNLSWIGTWVKKVMTILTLMHSLCQWSITPPVIVNNVSCAEQNNCRKSNVPSFRVSVDNPEELFKYLREGVFPEELSSSQRRVFAQKAMPYTIYSDTLYKRGPDSILRRVVPQPERLRLMELVHSEVGGGHFGAENYHQKAIGTRLVVAHNIPRCTSLCQNM